MKSAQNLKFEYILSTARNPEIISVFLGTCCKVLEVLNKEAVESPSSKIFKNRLDNSFWKERKIFYLALEQANGQAKLSRSLALTFMIPWHEMESHTSHSHH